MVFEQIGMSVEDTFMQTITTGVVGLVATFIAIAFVEKLGRRVLTLAGLVLVVVAHTSTWYGFSQASYMFDQETVTAIKSELNKENIDTSSIEGLLGSTFDNDVTLKK